MALINRVQNGFRQFTGQLLNQIIDRVNGTVAGVFTGTFTNMTITGTRKITPAVVAATGSSISTVRALAGAGLTLMTTVSASAMGVRLPAWATGKQVQIQNIGTTSGSVYPGTGARIGAAATNARTTIAKRKGTIFTGSSVASTWEVLVGN